MKNYIQKFLHCKSNKKIEFSKKLLVADYLIAIMILFFLIFCAISDAIYITNIQSIMIETNTYVDIKYPYELTNLTIILSIWIGQLGISSTAYYIMCKSDHKVQLPIKMLNTFPDDIKDKIDLTSIVTTLLSNSDN